VPERFTDNTEYNIIAANEISERIIPAKAPITKMLVGKKSADVLLKLDVKLKE